MRRSHPLVLLALLGLFSCLKRDEVHRTKLPRRDPALAEQDAQRDISRGDVKIIYGGTIASVPVGVPSSLWYLARDAESSHSSPGCVVNDRESVTQETEYALAYNRAVVRHLLERRGQSSDVLDSEIEKETKSGEPHSRSDDLGPD